MHNSTKMFHGMANERVLSTVTSVSSGYEVS